MRDLAGNRKRGSDRHGKLAKNGGSELVGYGKPVVTRKLVIPLILILALCPVLLSGCGAKDAGTGDGSISVSVEQEAGGDSSSVDADGADGETGEADGEGLSAGKADEAAEAGNAPGGQGSEPGGPGGTVAPGAGTASAGTSAAGGKGSGGPACTISISCATILNNMDLCEDSVKGLVPSDGWILRPVKVELRDGESAFDVLKRVCRDKGIHMEFSMTPAYGTAYVEGIANIYEFSAGDLSGWMYKVNGVFPNYGSSGYTMKDGDTLAWVYTCDLGKDVGGGRAAG